MATNKIASPNVAMYGSDPMQQIFARGVLDRDMSGLSYMFKNAADRDRGQAVSSYEQGLREANQMSAALTQQELAQEQMLGILKASAGLMEKGFAPSGMRVASTLFNDPNANDAFSQATLAKLLAEAAASNAKASSEGQDKYTVETQVTPSGVAYGTYKGTGRNPEGIQAEIKRRILADLQARGLTTDPNKPMAIPRANPQDATTAKSLRYPGAQ